MMSEAKEIIKAAKTGDLNTVTRLITGKPDLINALDRNGSMPLHCAVWQGHADVVLALLDAGADVEVHNENSHWGTTPLHAAAHGNQKAVAQILVDRGADINVRSPLNGMTALEHTNTHKAKAVAKILIDNGREA